MAALQPLSSVHYGKLSVPASAKSDVDAAFSYLSGDSVERSLIDRVERGSRTYRLAIVHDGNDRFDPNSDTIYWDPHSALRTTSGGTQSPALGLAHELDHAAESPSREDRLANARVARYDNLEERRVIRGSERHAARTLGEAVRYDHGGTVYRVATPVSR